jgi:hypothetical protein
MSEITQQQVEQAWKRCAEQAFAYWREQIGYGEEGGPRYKNPPTYRVPIQQPVRMLSTAMLDDGPISEQLIPVITFRIHRMRPEYGNGCVVECVNPKMIVHKG